MQKFQNKKQIQRRPEQFPKESTRTINLWDGAIRICLFVTLFTVPLAFSYWQRGGYELFFPIKIFFTQILLIFALAIFIMKSIMSGEILWVKTPLNFPVLAFFIAGLLSLPGSMNVHIALNDLYRIFFYVLFYFLFINYVRTRKEITVMLTVVMLTFAVVNFYGVLQRFRIDLLAPAGGRTGVDSTLGNPDFYAGYLISIIPVILSCIFIVKREWRVPLGILVVAGIAFLFLTQSRAGFLGLFFSFLLFVFFILKKGELKKEARVWVISLACIAVTLLIVLSFKGGTTLSRIRESLDLKSINIRFRLLCYKSTLNILKDHPITGTGAGTFYNVYPKYRVPEMKEVFTFIETPKYAHNDFLQIGSEMGLLGLGAFGWLLFVFFKTGAQSLAGTKESYWRWIAIGTICSLAGMLVQMVFDFNFYRPETTLHFWLLIAIMSVLWQRRQAESRLSGRGEEKTMRIVLANRAKIISGILGIVIISLMSRLSLGPLIGNIHYNKGLRLERLWEKTQDKSQRLTLKNAVLNEFKKAIKIEKINDAYYTKLGTFYGNLARNIELSDQEKKEYMMGAVENFDRASELCPYYAVSHYNSGQAYLFYALAFDRTLIEKAEERLKKALLFSSYSEAEHFHNQLGLLYKERGMLDGAIKEYESALKINPKTIQSLINLGNVYYAKGWYDKAIEIYFKALDVDKNCADALNNLGNAYYQKRMFDRAIECYKKVILVNPGYIDAYNNLGSVYFVAGMYNEAKPQFLKVTQLVPNSSQANYARSMLSRIH